MGIFDVNLKPELEQLESAVGRVVDNKFAPLVERAIKQAGDSLNGVVLEASAQLQSNIQTLSGEIHNQRRMTREDIEGLIDYATIKIGESIDQRVERIRQETSVLLEEKIGMLKNELNDAAIRSRRTLYFNLCISIGAALLMAAIGLVYKKISLGQLDIFSLFRVLLLAAVVGTSAFSLLKLIGQWRGFNREKKNISVILVSYIGAMRPNGAIGYFMASIALAAIWVLVNFYA
ncbi:hypothetical protein [Chromobacterium amazonense]|uniref:hypothetical protein n=1 Tax=Chromobacterium amazonense TaxID=1382803 RepID=UPI003F796FCA